MGAAAAIVTTLAVARGQHLPPTNASWVRADNTTALAPTEAWEQSCVCEPEVLTDADGRFRMYYRGGWDRQSVGVAFSDDGRSWTKHAGNPIWGGGGSGVNGTNDGGQPWVAVVGGVYWLFTTTNCCGTGCSRVNIATSPDGLTFANHTDARVPLPDGATYYGNRVAWTEPDGSWRMLQEVGPSIWQIYLYASDDGAAWRLLNDGRPLASLQPHAGGMYGGPSFAHVDSALAPRGADGAYYLWFHAGASAGNLPTDVYCATSTDLVEWAPCADADAGVVLEHRGDGYFDADQTADPSPVVVGGAAFLYYDGDDNVKGAASIGVAVAAATGPPLAAPGEPAARAATSAAEPVDLTAAEPVDLTVSISAITLMTPNITLSAQFYRALGFQETYASDSPPWRTYSVGSAGALNLQGVNATTPFGVPWGRPVIWVKDVDAMYAQAVAAGLTPEFPPADADWGERYFHILDPVGHEIAFATPL